MQCIPLDEKLRGLDAYKQFLAARREEIAKRLNAYLGPAPVAASAAGFKATA